MAGFRWSFGVVSDCVAAEVPLVGSLHAGSLFAGRYRIVDTLGTGASGQVFRADDLVVSRPVALKVLANSLDSKQRLRFLREGELTARLNHPGIVRVHGGGVSEDGRAFLVLELVEGARPLLRAIRERSDGGLDLLIDAARAVGFAHRKGLVHRDLKPENVLVDSEGHVRVCDFGLAWEIGLDRLTQTGQMLGTPLYMAPEQFSASSERPPGVSTDVWSLGVLLYEALTDRLPFSTGGTLAELMAQIARASPPPPRALAKGVSAQLEAVCLKALSKNPTARQRDASDFADELERAQARHRRSGRSLNPAVLVGGVTLVVLTSAFLLWQGGGGGEAPNGVAVVETPPSEVPPVDAPPPVEAPRRDTRRARLLLIELNQPLRRPGFDAQLVDRLDEALLLAAGDSELSAEIELARLSYLFRRGRWEQVVEQAPEVRARLRGRPVSEVVLLHALSLYELMRREEAAAVCQQHLSRGPAAEVVDLTLAAWQEIARYQADRAQSYADRALAMEPNLVPALLAKASAHGLRMQMFDCRQALGRVETLAPDHPTLYRGLMSEAVQRREFEEARVHGERLLALLEPEPPHAVLHAQSQVLYNLEQWEEVRQLLDRILTRDPENLWATFTRGMVFMKLRDPRGLSDLRALHRDYPLEFEQMLSGIDPRRAREELLRRVLGR